MVDCDAFKVQSSYPFFRAALVLIIAGVSLQIDRTAFISLVGGVVCLEFGMMLTGSRETGGT